MRGQETPKFDAINCKDNGRRHRCKLMYRNQVQDTVAVDEVNTMEIQGNNRVTRVTGAAYLDKLSMSFDKPTTGRVRPEKSALEIQL